MKGHRLDPGPEELVHILEEKGRDSAFTDPDVKDDNVYKYQPSELLEGWFYFKLENYGKSNTLISRTAIGGSWNKSGKDQLVEATDSNKPILIKKIFVFKEKINRTTNWVMHEYSEIHGDHNSNKQGQGVLCFIKRNPDKKRKASHTERKPEKKSKRKPSRIERKPEKKRKTSSSLEEGQPSDSLDYDSGYNAAQDILEVEPRLQPNENKPYVTKNISPEIQLLSESQLLPNQHMSPIIGDHVANAILSQLESQLLPNHRFEDYVANSLFSEIESQLLPNHHLSSNIENHAAKDIFSGVRPLVPPQRNELIDCNGLSQKTFSLQSPIYPTPGSSCSALQSPIHLLPESLYSGSFSNNLTNRLELDHNSFSALPVPIYPQLESSYSSGFSNYSTSGLDQNPFSSLPVPIYPLLESSYSSRFSNYSTSGLDQNSFSALPVPIYPPQESSYSSRFSNYSTSGLDQNYFSALPVPIYPPPESSYFSGFSNVTNGLNHNSFSALQFPIHPPLESSYSSGFSNDSTSGLDHNSFSALPVPIYPPLESSYSSGFSNDSTNGLDHNSFSGLQFPIHPLPESSYSSGFSNDATNGLNHNSFSALQSPTNTQPGSHSSGIINGSDVWNPQFAAEQEDDLANSHWSVQDDFSSPETGHTFPSDFNSSKAVAGGYAVNDSDAVIETVSAWPNEYSPMANGEYHINSSFLNHDYLGY